LLQACRNCGAGAPIDAHFCPQCSQLLAIGRNGDFFTFLGLPRKLGIDPSDLEQRFRRLSRQFHPDYFFNASPGERRASLERSSYLNDAYRTLRHPIARAEYLLGLEGFKPAGPEEAARQVPADLLEEIFALNEELDAIRELRAGGAESADWQSRLHSARRPIEAKRDAHEARLAALSAQWDALVDAGGSDAERRGVLEALRDQILERQYINNLLAGMERELSNA
jgi:molecular chaperone HscB